MSCSSAFFQLVTTCPSTSRPGLFGNVSGRALFGTFGGAFVFDVADRQPEQFHCGGVVGELAAVLMTLRIW